MSKHTFFNNSHGHVSARTFRLACYAIVFFAVTLLGILNAVYFAEHAWIGWMAVAFFGPGVLLSGIQILKPAPVTKNSDAFVVRRSSWAAISYLLLCSGWMVGGLILLTHKPETAWISFTFSYLCAFGIVLSLWQFFDPRPLVVINERGYYDRSLGIGLIPWSSINGAQIKTVQGTEVISLELKFPELVMSERSIWQKLDSQINQIVGFELMHLGVVRINALYIDEALDFILAKCATQSELDKYSALSEL